MTGTFVLIAFVVIVVALVSVRVQTHARWHRERPADEAWLTQLKSFNVKEHR